VVSQDGILYRRLRYFLTPQFDLYRSIGGKVLGGNVLEVGFGTGAGVMQYAHKADKVHAIEIDSEAVEFAQMMWPLPNVAWMVNDICTFRNPIRYDYAIMIEALEHIRYWEDALGSILGHMKSEATFFMTARNNNADLSRWNELHEREWTAWQLRQSLEQFFGEVTLWDWSLTREQNSDTSLTPLVAMCRP